MTLYLGDGDVESFVKFKDYEFFVPMDAANSDAIIKGMAYKNETTVEELRHYAQDAGKSQEEIDAIVEPIIEYTFMADGVYLKKVNSESKINISFRLDTAFSKLWRESSKQFN